MLAVLMAGDPKAPPCRYRPGKALPRNRAMCDGAHVPRENSKDKNTKRARLSGKRPYDDLAMPQTLGLRRRPATNRAAPLFKSDQKSEAAERPKISESITAPPYGARFEVKTE